MVFIFDDAVCFVAHHQIERQHVARAVLCGQANVHRLELQAIYILSAKRTLLGMLVAVVVEVGKYARPAEDVAALSDARTHQGREVCEFEWGWGQVCKWGRGP